MHVSSLYVYSLCNCKSNKLIVMYNNKMKRRRSFSVRLVSNRITKPSDLKSMKYPHSLQKIIPDGDSIANTIHRYIESRNDVEILTYYEEYRQQFFAKCTKLQVYLISSPAVRDQYLSDSDSHFLLAMQYLFLDLFRKGIITRGSHTNLRQEAVDVIQEWALGWIRRKISYETVKQE